jgi:hypothetical protein
MFENNYNKSEFDHEEVESKLNLGNSIQVGALSVSKNVKIKIYIDFDFFLLFYMWKLRECLRTQC